MANPHISPLPSDHDFPDLLHSPHCVPLIVDLLIDERDLNEIDTELLIDHLLVCSLCRIAVLVFLSAFREQDSRDGYPTAPVDKIIEQILSLHKALGQGY